jgi:FMN reductase
MRLSVVVGNPRPRSRTLLVAEAVANRVADMTGWAIERTVDLCDYAEALFTWPDTELESIGDYIAASDLVVFASPTYKASYTGLLKAFLDRYPNNGLADITAIPVMTGGSEAHAMAVDMTMRPLLVELGASVPTRALFFSISRVAEMNAVVDEWAAANLDALPGSMRSHMRRGADGQ